MSKTKKQNRFVKWVNGLSSYTKNKTINALAFFFAFFIIGGANYAIMFGQFVPTFFVLDLFIIVIAIAPIFFFKTTMFDRIYLPIILFIVTVFYTINSGYYDYFKTVLSFKDIPFIIQNIDQAGYHAGEISWWIIVLNIVLFLLFAIGIVLYNALWRFEESNKELKIRRYKKIIFASSMLVGGLASFEFSLQMWCIAQRNDGILDIDYVNYFPNYHFSHLGMIGYYIQEARQLLFDKGASVEEIKEYLTHATYVDDEYTNFFNKQNMPNPNIFILLIETGDACMLNEKITPNLWALLHDGINLNHEYSHNHTNISEIIAVNGSYPMFDLDQSVKFNFPFNLPNILRDKNYKSYYAADIAPKNDNYKTMSFAKTFGFDNLLFHEQVIPQEEPWEYKWANYTRDSIYIDGLIKIMQDFPTKHQSNPFYMHYMTIHMHCDQVITDQNQQMFEDLNEQFGPTLSAAEASGEWRSPFKEGTDADNRFRRWALKTMDFDYGLGRLMDLFYGKVNPYFNNTLLFVVGDHGWTEIIRDDGLNHSFAQRIKNVMDIDNLKLYSTVGGIYNPTLNEYYHTKNGGDSNFNKATWPTVIVPTVLDLLGVKYNPRMYQGKSIFQNDFDENEVYYSGWVSKYMNEHYTSSNGHSITKVFDDNGEKQQFLEKMNEMKHQTRILNSIYMKNLFAQYDYKDFLPQAYVFMEYDSKKIGLLI